MDPVPLGWVPWGNTGAQQAAHPHSKAALPQFTHPCHEKQDGTRLVEVEVEAAGVHRHGDGAHSRHRLLQRRLAALGHQRDGGAVGRPVPGVVPAAGGVLRGGRGQGWDLLALLCHVPEATRCPLPWPCRGRCAPSSSHHCRARTGRRGSCSRRGSRCCPAFGSSR